MYARGMTTREIEGHLQEIYGQTTEEPTPTPLVHGEKQIKMSTVDSLAGQPVHPPIRFVTQDGQLVEPRLIRVGRSVQDGHTAGEQMVYQNLWNRAAGDQTPEPSLAAMTRSLGTTDFPSGTSRESWTAWPGSWPLS